MIPQIFIPIAAQFSRPENKGRNVGIVLSGLLTGILASRVVSGFIGELIGWREMYHIAAGMMFICAIVVLKILSVSLSERIPATAHLFDPGGTEFRFPPRHVVLSGF